MGARQAHFLSFLCSLRQNFCQMIGWRVSLGFALLAGNSQSVLSGVMTYIFQETSLKMSDQIKDHTSKYWMSVVLSYFYLWSLTETMK